MRGLSPALEKKVFSRLKAAAYRCAVCAAYAAAGAAACTAALSCAPRCLRVRMPLPAPVCVLLGGWVSTRVNGQTIASVAHTCARTHHVRAAACMASTGCGCGTQSTRTTGAPVYAPVYAHACPYTRDRSGTLELNELKSCVRRQLRIPPQEFSDAEVGPQALGRKGRGSTSAAIAQ